MCSGSEVAETAHRAAEKLADLMHNEMGMAERINPVELRMFLQLHWRQVSRLAHIIHAAAPNGDKT